MTSNYEDLNLKPNFLSFILVNHSGLIGAVFSTIVFLFLGIFLSSFLFVYFVLCLIATLVIYAFIKVSYNKEKYTITGSKIIYSYGTIFSDNSIEININKITQVTLRLGFIENKLFKTGRLIVQTAGSSSSKVVIKSIDSPNQLYEEIQKRMQTNGFRLKKENLVQSEKPHIIGVLGESLKGMIFNIFIVFYILSGVIFEDENGKVDYDRGVDQISNTDTLTIFIIGLIILIGLVIMFIFRYLDVKKRVYEIYDDSVFYSEGFLTKNYSFLPMESISDAENKQSFFSKIFGIHDLIISSEGSSGQVYFFNMVNGRKMMETIKFLKQNINTLHNNDEKNENGEIVLEVNDNNQLVEIDEKVEKRNYNEEFVADYQPDMKKTILANIIYLFPIVTIPILVIEIIKAKYTTYSIGKNSLDYKYEFLNTKYNSFSVDKITQINFYESILDRIIGTCSIEIFSIGSNKSLKFKNIKKYEGLEEKILSKVGIYKEEKVGLDISFNLLNWIKSSGIQIIYILILTIFLLSLFVSIIFDGELNIYTGIIIGFIFIWSLIGVLSYLYRKCYYSIKWYSQNVYKDFVESIAGIIIKTKKYANLDNVKAVECKKYPLTKTGNIILNVSGETIIEYGQKQKYRAISANGIKMEFVSNCFDIVDEFDSMLNKGEIDKTEITRERQNVGNSLIFIVLGVSIFLLFISGIPEIYPIFILGISSLIILIIGLFIWYIKSKIYILQNTRILNYYGIIYKSKKSILYKKIDFIEKNQGFIHKIFGNGNLAIFTKGSGSSDAKIVDISKFVEFYDLIKNKIM